MTTLILKGNRSCPLSVRPDAAPILKGVAYVNTWLQTCEPVDIPFVESIGDTQSTWEVHSATMADEFLLERLKISPDRLAELRKFKEFGALFVVRIPGDPDIFSVDAVFVVAEKIFERIANKLQSVLADDHDYYTFSVGLGHYPANHEKERLPSFAKFKAGAPCHFDGVMFTIIREAHPDRLSHVEIARS